MGTTKSDTPPSTPPTPLDHPLADVFASASLSDEAGGNQLSDELFQSDLAHLRGIHTNNGYREGLQAAKATTVQAGFDEGYPLGAHIGYKVGEVLGILEVLADIEQTRAQQLDDPSMHTMVCSTTFREAQHALLLENVFSSQYWDKDACWTFEVSGKTDQKGEQGSKDDVLANDATFVDVATCHPLLKSWSSRARHLAIESGLTVSL